MLPELSVKIEPDTRVDLDALPTAVVGLDKADGRRRLLPLLEELSSLQELMWGARLHALLVVLQGRDSSGKDGLINHVLGCVNPQGLTIRAFAAPSAEEQEHDFLWRVHAAAPRKGTIGVFNRSHYEHLVAGRVHQRLSARQLEAACAQVNAFEELLAESGTRIVKFHLHLGRDEQRRRLLERERDIEKAWKLTPDDWRERARWTEYTAAYEMLLRRCSPPHAPWHVVPADLKWTARLAVAHVLVDALRPLSEEWMDRLSALQKERLAELRGVKRL